MLKHINPVTLFICGFLVASHPVSAAETGVPEPFREFDASSRYTIKYDELNEVLKKVVVDVGRSNREKAEPVIAKTGTRTKANVKRSTINEANRFYYEIFGGDELAQQVPLDIQRNLEQLPAEVPLKYFSRNEQLAYWLNLYNITLINQIIEVYPERKLKKMLVGKKSVLDKKLLTVAGVPLSLNDIQYTILKQNSDNNPLIMYGLYQGNIGGPNIRKLAYTGANVQRNLADNAAEFINSNRGTYPKDEKVFRASSLYDRNRGYFRNFQEDLKKHLMVYIEEPERRELQASSVIKPDITDWTVTDLYGSYPQTGGSLADNSAALLGSVQATTPGNDGSSTVNTGFSNVSGRLISKSSPVSMVSPELMVYLREIKAKQDGTNLDKASVTVEELGEVPVTPADGMDQDSDEKENE